MRVLSIVGPSGSGKTTLLVRLVPALKARGLSVVAVKHTHHRGIDADDSDSARLVAAGADAVALVAPDRFASFEARAAEPSLAEVLTRLPHADVVLVEGWKAERLPCVELVAVNGERVDAASLGDRIALVAPAPDPAARVFGRDEVESLATVLSAWARS